MPTKPSDFSKFIAGILIWAGAYAALADKASPLYVHGDVGAAFVNSTATSGALIINGLFVPRAPLHFNTGVRGDLALGWRFNDSWAAEIEAGVIHNAIPEANGDMYQIPTLLNAIYEIPLKHSLRPCLGAGVGAAVTRLNGNFFQNQIPPVALPIHDSDVTFGFQATAGVKYEITSSIVIDLEYKFFGTTDHSWHSSSGSTLESDGIYSNSVLASFTWKF